MPIENAKTASPVKVGARIKKGFFFGTAGCLFFGLISTLLLMAGESEMGVNSVVWKFSVLGSLSTVFLNILIYYNYNNTDKLAGNGFYSLMILLACGWLFGFATFYFYFVFSPINNFIRFFVLVTVTTAMLYRAYTIKNDIMVALEKNKRLIDAMYVSENGAYSFTRDSIRLLEKEKPSRNPFKEWYIRTAILVTPFTLVLNKLTSPITGNGHGVFMVLAFLTVPIMLWGIGILVQTILVMIYYPIKIERETGKPVLMKNW